MSNIQCLPFLEGTKFIVVDEGVEATFAETLITGWLKMWQSKNLSNKIEMLLFSSPKHLHADQFNSMKLDNINISDFYSIKANETESIPEKLQKYLTTFPQNSIVIINCLSTLSLSVGLEKTISFVEKLKEKAGQLIGISRRDFGNLNIPKIETYGTTYLKLEQHFRIAQNNTIAYEGRYTHRKPGGGILRQSEFVTQDVTTYEITSAKISNDSSRKTKKAFSEKPKAVQTSFRIEMSDKEMEQRRNTPLPYTAAINPQKTTIYYEPEDVDDDEEEDLDGDLDI
ncbi:uncharacterized protein LOC117174382 [Belonocnema kinseyi]|uniref:uncharacterized protein LOC117174382 n=1 Tax=Belonocnema kinseyi TaxID=2817044 RepID=UPI00143DD9D0|nr:uncharacterized protein LOC117174382 [Belonocnema kinseyi]